MKITNYPILYTLILVTSGCVTNQPTNTLLVPNPSNETTTEASPNDAHIANNKSARTEKVKKKNKNTTSGQQEYLLDRQSADRVCMTEAMQGRIDKSMGNAQNQVAIASTTASMSAAMPLSAMGAVPGLGLIAGVANIAMMNQAQQPQPQFDQAECISDFMEARGW